MPRLLILVLVLSLVGFNSGLNSFPVPDTNQENCYARVESTGGTGGGPGGGDGGGPSDGGGGPPNGDGTGDRGGEDSGGELPGESGNRRTLQVISCDGTGQDASYITLSQTFCDNGDETITDLNTDLIWTQKVYGEGLTFEDVEAEVPSFTLAGYNNWRIPTIKELYTLSEFNGKTGRSQEENVPFIDSSIFEVSVDSDIIVDSATGLEWMRADSSSGLEWDDALEYCNGLTLGGYDDWRLPDAHELQSIVDYSRSPDETNSAAIDPIFECTKISNEAGDDDFGWYWTNTTHLDGVPSGSYAVYIAFGRATGNFTTPNGDLLGSLDVHGAGAQRSDPKIGPLQGPSYFGPQGDYRRTFNMVRCVRGSSSPSPDAPVGCTSQPSEAPSPAPSVLPTVFAVTSGPGPTTIPVTPEPTSTSEPPTEAATLVPTMESYTPDTSPTNFPSSSRPTPPGMGPPSTGAPSVAEDASSSHARAVGIAFVLAFSILCHLFMQ